MPTQSHVSDIAEVIRLSVAPVFLLTAVGTLLGVLNTRLGRIVDRARTVEARLRGLPEAEHAPLHGELRSLSRRSRLVYWALTLGTGSALLVCLTIAAAFLGFVLRADFSGLMALLFVGAMAGLTGTLVLFLREVFVAVATVRLGPR